MKVLIPGSADNEYRTSDISLIQALMSLDHRPVRIEVEGNKDYPMIYYVFNEDTALGDINDLLTNGDRQVSIRQVWAANQVWTMNVRRSRNN